MSYHIHRFRNSTTPVNKIIEYLGSEVASFPDDVIANVNKDNWEELFDKYMVIPGNGDADFADKGKFEYIWKTDVMKAFIKHIVENL